MMTTPAGVTAEVPASTHDRVTRKRVTPAKKTRIELASEFDKLPLDALATRQQTAAYLNCSKAKLERDAWAGTGIPYLKIGRQVRYRKSDVLAFLAGKVRKSTTEAA